MPALTFHSRSLTELITNRARDHGDTPAIYTAVSPPSDPMSPILHTLTYSQLNQAVDQLAWHYAGALGVTAEQVRQDQSVRVVAVLVPSSIYESLLECALAKLGACALLLSVNNSAPAVAHLCKLTKAATLIWGGRYKDRALEAAELLRQEGIDVELVEEQRFELWGEDKIGGKPFVPFLEADAEGDRTAVILHSSGSTGFPKPVYITHYGLVANIALNQNKTAFSTLPVFHGYGHFAVFRAIYSLKPLTLFPSYLPLTAANIVKILDEATGIPGARPFQCFAVPYVIKLLAENKQGCAALASFDVVSYAGAALPDDLGHRLTQDYNVNLLSIYGTTETGSLLNSMRDFDNDKAWDWIRPFAQSKPFLVFEDRGDDTYEIVVKDGYPPKIETNRADGSYATKDLFRRHPTQRDWYKYVGRLDDTLVQTLGEKTNPVPIELGIRGNSPYVSEAIVFGAGRPFIGALISPSPLALEEGLVKETGVVDELIPADEAKAFIDRIWPVIEQANAQAPSHSRITRSMVGVLRYGTEVPVATKMSILRPACYAKFKTLIDGIYDSTTDASSPEDGPLLDIDIPAPPTTSTALENYILSLILSTQTNPTGSRQLTKTDDLFEYGVDSLQGAKIRNDLQKLVATKSKEELGQNVVYEYPSVVKLANHIVEVVHGYQYLERHDEEEQLMLDWVNNYAAQLVESAPLQSRENDNVVLLTGASGSLGAHILSNLVSSDKVKRVICISRAKSHTDSLDRVKSSVQQRKLNISPEGWAKVVSYAGDISEQSPHCGLTDEEWNGLGVSIVIHNAWPVNFNLSLSSYRQHIGGAIHLLNLARSSGASFFFSSSISSRQASSTPTCPETFAGDNETQSAVRTGYARSKWVVEKILERSAGSAGALRIGQMVGDTVSGVWNETEAWPLMFKGAKTVGAIPITHDSVSWLPVDYAGSSIAQIALKYPAIERPTVYNVVNPYLSSWDDIIIPGLKQGGLSFAAVPVKEWLERLKASDDDVEKNPVKKLAPFFEKRYAGHVSGDAKPPVVFETEKTCETAPVLKETPPVTVDLVAKWVHHWASVGFV